MPSTPGGFSSVYDIVPAEGTVEYVRVPDEENEETNIKLKGCEAEMETRRIYLFVPCGEYLGRTRKRILPRTVTMIEFI